MGTYLGGNLMKCTDCLDIAKKTDASSCPVGSKLFSPQNTEDWATFLNSEASDCRPTFHCRCYLPSGQLHSPHEFRAAGHRRHTHSRALVNIRWLPLVVDRQDRR